MRIQDRVRMPNNLIVEVTLPESMLERVCVNKSTAGAAKVGGVERWIGYFIRLVRLYASPPTEMPATQHKQKEGVNQ